MILVSRLRDLTRLREALVKFLSANLFVPSFSKTVVRYLNQFAAKASELSLIGGLFAALALELLKRALGLQMARRPTYTIVYGACPGSGICSVTGVSTHQRQRCRPAAMARMRGRNRRRATGRVQNRLSGAPDPRFQAPTPAPCRSGPRKPTSAFRTPSGCSAINWCPQRGRCTVRLSGSACCSRRAALGGVI